MIYVTKRGLYNNFGNSNSYHYEICIAIHKFYGNMDIQHRNCATFVKEDMVWFGEGSFSFGLENGFLSSTFPRWILPDWWHGLKVLWVKSLIGWKWEENRDYEPARSSIRGVACGLGYCALQGAKWSKHWSPRVCRVDQIWEILVDTLARPIIIKAN